MSLVSKPVLRNVVPLVQELGMCTELLDLTSLGFRISEIEVCLTFLFVWVHMFAGVQVMNVIAS